MFDGVSEARILDLLGNRNRRRILALLKHKPCFVTEISDRLEISPKAVIEHLHMMEREEILSFRRDDRRRKYYYLANDISISIRLTRQETAPHTDHLGELPALLANLSRLTQMVRAREEIADAVGQLDASIDDLIRNVMRKNRTIIGGDEGMNVTFALAHGDLTCEEIGMLTGLPPDVLDHTLNVLAGRKIIEKDEERYRLRDAHAT